MTRATSSRPDPHTSNRSQASAVASAASGSALRRDILRDYLELTKPEITLLVVLSALGGFLLAPSESFDLSRLIFLLLGVALTAGGASVLNHWLERELDGRMRRTMARPLPSGRISADRARNFGYSLVGTGVAVLCPLTNPLTGVLALSAAVLYVLVYTPLKQVTSWNTLIGTVPGALPALGGWTAATGSFGWGGWVIFAVLAAWQMPHFLALAWMYKKDYARGGHLMLPVEDPSGVSTVNQTLFFTVVLVGVSLLPVVLSLAGLLYGASAAVLGAWFVREAYVFYRTYSVQDARRVLKVSIYYVPALVLAILLDQIALVWIG